MEEFSMAVSWKGQQLVLSSIPVHGRHTKLIVCFTAQDICICRWLGLSGIRLRLPVKRRQPQVSSGYTRSRGHGDKEKKRRQGNGRMVTYTTYTVPPELLCPLLGGGVETILIRR